MSERKHNNQLNDILEELRDIMVALPELEREKAIKELKDISDFYRDQLEYSLNSSKTNNLLSLKIKGKGIVKSVKVRPPLAFD